MNPLGHVSLLCILALVSAQFVVNAKNRGNTQFAATGGAPPSAVSRLLIGTVVDESVPNHAHNALRLTQSVLWLSEALSHDVTFLVVVQSPAGEPSPKYLEILRALGATVRTARADGGLRSYRSLLLSQQEAIAVDSVLYIDPNWLVLSNPLSFLQPSLMYSTAGPTLDFGAAERAFGALGLPFSQAATSTHSNVLLVPASLASQLASQLDSHLATLSSLGLSRDETEDLAFSTAIAALGLDARPLPPQLSADVSSSIAPPADVAMVRFHPDMRSSFFEGSLRISDFTNGQHHPVLEDRLKRFNHRHGIVSPRILIIMPFDGMTLYLPEGETEMTQNCVFALQNFGGDHSATIQMMVDDHINFRSDGFTWKKDLQYTAVTRLSEGYHTFTFTISEPNGADIALQSSVQLEVRPWPAMPPVALSPDCEMCGALYSSRPVQLPTREVLGWYLNLWNLTGVGAEVGVQKGDFAKTVLEVWKGRQLNLVDPWIEQTSDYIDEANVPQTEQDARYMETRDKVAKFGDRVVIHRLTSEQAAPLFADNSLDYVYIDARHDYAAAKEDLHFWWPKVKKGGLFCGHDYLDGLLEPGIFGVKSAVDEFAVQVNRAVLATYQEPVYRSWYFFK